MLVKVIAPFISSDGARNPDDQFELEDKLTTEYINDGLVVPVPVVKRKETAQVQPVEATGVNPIAK